MRNQPDGEIRTRILNVGFNGPVQGHQYSEQQDFEMHSGFNQSPEDKTQPACNSGQILVDMLPELVVLELAGLHCRSLPTSDLPRAGIRKLDGMF